MSPNRSLILRWGRTVLLIAVVIVCGVAAAWLGAHQSATVNSQSAGAGSEGEKILRTGENRVTVPLPMAERMGLVPAEGAIPATVQRAREPIPLPIFQGTLALDSNSLQRIHSRFAGEIVALGTGGDAGRPAGAGSLLSAPGAVGPKVGDRIEAGQLLAVVWSKDLGEKKSELVDAVSKLKLDAIAAARLRELYKQNGTAEKSVLDAERAVESDRIAIERIERTLLAWRLTEADLKLIRAEADKIGDPGAIRTTAADWARVEIRAGAAGVLLEKNVGAGDIVDTATDLFKIGGLGTLAVWAHVYEEDLHLLSDIGLPIEWAVSLPSKPGMEPYRGKLEQIGSVIDPNQHTALVSGWVENPKGELKIGQSVTVSLKRKANADELTIPTDALIEDGKGSTVFVQPDPAKTAYERRPVTVLRRTRELVYLTDREAPTAAILGAGLSRAACVREGDRIAGAGSLLLNEAMNAAGAPAK